MLPGYTFFVILLCSVIDYTSADAVHLMMVSNASCSVTNEVNQFDSYQLNWNGDMLPPKCKLGFTGKGILKSHHRLKICVKAYVYDVTECNFKMKYYCKDRADPAKEYTCGTVKPQVFCAIDNLYIEVSSPTSATSSFQLIVTAEQTSKEPEKNFYLVFCIVAALSLLCMLIVCVLILMVFKKYKLLKQRMGENRTTTGRNSVQASAVHGAGFPTGMQNQGYVNTEQGFYPRAVNVSLPAYSEKEEKNDPPAYTEASTNGTKA